MCGYVRAMKKRSVDQSSGARVRSTVSAANPGTRHGSNSDARLLPHLVGLDHVVDLDVVERAEADTALEALADLGGVVLEPAQRLDAEVLGHHRAVPDEPGLGVAADETRAHQASRDVAELG